MLEVVAITFDGPQAAERRLSDLRASRDDSWLGEVSIIEHDTDGRYSVKAKNPAVGDRHAGKGAAIGGLTGLFVGALGGPLGLVLWSRTGALIGGSVGASSESAFMPLVAEFEDRLAPGASMQVLVGETPSTRWSRPSAQTRPRSSAAPSRATRLPSCPRRPAERAAGRPPAPRRHRPPKVGMTE